MKVLLDTNLLITGLRPEAVARYPNARFYTSALCYAELSEGEFSSDAKVAMRAGLQLHDVRSLYGRGLPFADRESQVYRTVCQAISSAGGTLNRVRRVDMMIAATAISRDMALGTRNVKDFRVLASVLEVVEF